MNKFEIILLVAVMLVPIIALLLVVKFKRKSKQEQPAKETEQKVEADQLKDEKTEQDNNSKTFDSPSISKDEFKGYLQNRKPNNSAQSYNFRELNPPMYRYNPMNVNPNMVQPQKKSIKEEIKSLSPELKAMLIAGVLDRKNY